MLTVSWPTDRMSHQGMPKTETTWSSYRNERERVCSPQHGLAVDHASHMGISGDIFASGL